MRVRRDVQSESAVPPLSKIVADLEKKLQSLKDVWSQRLNENPSGFGQVEVEVHHKFQEMADQVVAGLLAQVGQQSSLEDAAKKSR